MQKMVPCLWFDTQAEEAANFYVSVFNNSKILQTTHYPEDMHGKKEGSVLTVLFELDGQKFMALNGGPQFKFSEAISIMVNCETQQELDAVWEKLTADGGEEIECGWLRDKYGLSWQIVPAIIEQLFDDPITAEKAMRAVWQMKKLDIETIQQAVLA